MSSLKKWAQSPVSMDFLAVFRFCFGILLAWEMGRYLYFGWAEAHFSNESYHFPYWGLDWIKALPPAGMKILFSLAGIFALGISFGFFYRFCTLSFTLFLGYFFFLDKANYLNHFYFIWLMSFLLNFIPAHRKFSLDVFFKRVKSVAQLPHFYLGLLQLQVLLVYFFAGLSKINPDWLNGQTIEPWLSQYSSVPAIGPLLIKSSSAFIFSWATMLIELSIAPLFLGFSQKRFALILILLSHFLNIYIFKLGTFSWTLIACNLLFLPPHWPERLRFWPVSITNDSLEIQRSKLLYGFVSIYFLLQIFLPLRHFFIPGDINWDKEGSRFAWRMRLNSVSGGVYLFFTSDQSPARSRVPTDWVLTPKQLEKLDMYPDLAIDFARFIAEKLEVAGHTNVRIYADSSVSLNDRPAQPLFNPNVDLTKVPKFIRNPQSYIVPLIK